MIVPYGRKKVIVGLQKKTKKTADSPKIDGIENKLH